MKGVIDPSRDDLELDEDHFYDMKWSSLLTRSEVGLMLNLF